MAVPAGRSSCAPTIGVNAVAVEACPGGCRGRRRTSRLNVEHAEERNVRRTARRAGRHPAARSTTARRAAASSSAWRPPSAGCRARRHQVELARAHHGVRARGIAVLDLTGEQPAHGLQSGVRMRRHHHPAGCGHVVRPVVVDEAPRADQRPGPLRQRATHRHRARTAERHHARFEDVDARIQHCGCDRRRLADQLRRILLQVAHGCMLIRR